MFSFPLLQPPLHVRKFIGCNAGSYILPVGEIALPVRRVRRGGQVKPEIGFGVVLRHALPHAVKHRQRTLRARVTLLRGLAIPVCGFHLVPRHAVPVGVALGRMNLSGQIRLPRRLEIPRRGLGPILCRFIGILRSSGAFCIRIAHCHLRRGVTAIRFRKQGGIH